jgi:dienelactone hydrolase
MKMTKRLLVAAILTGAMLTSIAEAANAADDANLAWEHALVVLPGGRNTTMRDALAAHDFDKVPPGTTTVLYLHGCSGQTPHDPTQFGKAGFLVIGPDSLKRYARRADCSGPNQTGMFPQAPAYRLQEIRYALSQLPTLPNVSMNKLILFGHSEGSKAAANWPGSEFRAIIITGWNCSTRDTSYAGLKAPENVAVMNIVAKSDEWLTTNRGSSCAAFLATHTVKEVINPDGTKHWLNDVYLQDILRFMRDNTR